jgi:RHS repeat-associated protein
MSAPPPYEICTSLPFGDWLQCTGSDSSPMHFTGQERDSESGLDNFGARYYGSNMGRFMSPDPLGGHMEDPQTLNRYVYVRNNPTSLTDPTGLDCVYISQDLSGLVTSGGCTNNNGIFVNGTIDTNSFNLTQSDNGDLSLNFGYTNDDTGNFSLFQTNLPGVSLFNNMNSPFSQFGQNDQLNPYAAQIFSQVYQNTRAVTNPTNIAAFYGLSALAGVAGPQLAQLAAKAPAALEALEELGTQLAYNPQFAEFASDFIQGYTPGAVPATLGGLAGFAASEIQSHWSQISQGVQNTYQQVRGSVPH